MLERAQDIRCHHPATRVQAVTVLPSRPGCPMEDGGAGRSGRGGPVGLVLVVVLGQ